MALRFWIRNRRSDLAYVAIIAALLAVAWNCDDRIELIDQHPLRLRLLSAAADELTTELDCDAHRHFSGCSRTLIIFRMSEAAALLTAHRNERALVSIKNNRTELFGRAAQVVRVVWAVQPEADAPRAQE